MDEVAHHTCRGEGGGMSMDDASTKTGGLGSLGGRPGRRGDGSMNGVASDDACDGE